MLLCSVLWMISHFKTVPSITWPLNLTIRTFFNVTFVGGGSSSQQGQSHSSGQTHASGQPQEAGELDCVFLFNNLVVGAYMCLS